MTLPYTIPSDPHAINMRRLGNLLWRMYMEVPLIDEHTALLGDIIETVGMQLAGGELYTSEVREAYEEINRHNASLDAPPPPAIPDDAFIPSNDAERLFGVPAGYNPSERDWHAPQTTPDIDCQDDYEFSTGTGRYAEPTDGDALTAMESVIAGMSHDQAYNMWDLANRAFWSGQMEQKHYERICALAKARMAEVEDAQ